MGLLTPQQLLFADEFSQVLIHESDQGSFSSDDGQGEVLDRAKERSIKKLVKSKDYKDKRLIDMIRIQYAQ